MQLATRLYQGRVWPETAAARELLGGPGQLVVVGRRWTQWHTRVGPMKHPLEVGMKIGMAVHPSPDNWVRRDVKVEENEESLYVVEVVSAAGSWRGMD